MALPITVGSGITIGGGIGIGNFSMFYNRTTIAVQNVAGSDGTTGFFFLGGSWPSTPSPSFNDIAAGWTVVQLPGAVVVSTDPGNQTITISGGTFISGQSYQFTGI